MKLKHIGALLLALACFAGSVLPVSAAATASASAGEFGTLYGELYDSAAYANGSRLYYYEISAGTTVTRSPGNSARVICSIELVNNATGAHIYEETFPIGTNGALATSYYVEMTELGVNLNNYKTYGAFGTHEARYTNGYVVYTNKTYNLKRDHGYG